MTESHNRSAPLELSLARAGFAFGLFVTAMLTLLSSTALLSRQFKSLVLYRLIIDHSGSANSPSLDTIRSAYEPGLVISCYILGGVLLAGSIIVYRGKYSLRLLMVCTFLVGIIGALPVRLIPKPSTHVTVFCAMDNTIASSQIDEINDQMKLRTLNTLPKDLLDELQLSPETALSEMRAEPGMRMTGVQLKFLLSPHLNEHQREMIVDYYAMYFESLCLEAARDNGFLRHAQNIWYRGLTNKKRHGINQ